MPKPPIEKQHNYVKTALRLPKELRDELQRDAEFKGRSMNAEILARLQGSQIDALLKQNEELKLMIREVLDIVRDKL